MTKYLLDTNHLSAYLDHKPGLVERIDHSLQREIDSAYACRCCASIAPAFAWVSVIARIALVCRQRLAFSVSGLLTNQQQKGTCLYRRGGALEKHAGFSGQASGGPYNPPPLRCAAGCPPWQGDKQ